MTEHDLSVARDVGELKADMRTVKHDVAGVQTSVNLLSSKIDGLTNQQSKGLGFFAGATFIVTVFGGALIVFAKLVIGGMAGASH